MAESHPATSQEGWGNQGLQVVPASTLGLADNVSPCCGEAESSNACYVLLRNGLAQSDICIPCKCHAACASHVW